MYIILYGCDKLINEELIKNWGVPVSTKDKNIKFIFNNDNLNSDFKNNNIIEDLGCDYKRAKFCLYDKENNKILLTMNFIIFGIDENPIFIGREKRIKLVGLFVNDVDMINKGIAKYYLKKLIEFGIYNKIGKFELYPNPSSYFFKNLDMENALNLEKLKIFYIKTFTNLGFNYEENEELGLIFKKL